MKELLKKVGCSIPIIIYVGLLVFSVITTMSSCNKPTEQEKLAEIVQNRFNDIDQHSFDGRTMSLDEAESILYCWADENSGMDISDEELREAIWVVLESTDLIRDLISEIDEIDVE